MHVKNPNLYLILVFVLLVSSMQGPSNVQTEQTMHRFSLRIMVQDNNYARLQIAYYIQDQLQQLGVNVSINIMSWSDAISYFLANNGSWDIFIVGFAGGILPFYDYSFINTCSGAFSVYINTCDPTYNSDLINSSLNKPVTISNDYLDQLVSETGILGYNFTLQEAHQHELQRILGQDVITHVPLLYLPNYAAVNSSIIDFDFTEGPLAAILRGAKRDLTKSNDLTFRYMEDPYFFYYFEDRVLNPFSLIETSSLIMPTLFFLESNGIPHPNMALSYSVSDWTDNNTGVTYENAHFSIKLRNDAYWINPMNISDTSKRITALDFKYAYTELMRQIQTYYNYRYYAYSLNTLEKVEANDTGSTLDLYFATSSAPSEIGFEFGRVPAIPSFLFSGNLTNANNYTTYTFAEPNSLIADSVEWANYTSAPWQGGPYYVPYNVTTGLEITTTNLTLVKNPHFWYPNENKLSGYFDLATPKTWPAVYFVNQDVGFDRIEIIMNDGTQDPLSMFESGEIDYVIYSKYTDINSYRSKISGLQGRTITNAYGEVLLFDLSNQYLSRYNVRRAILQSVNRTMLNEIAYNSTAIPVESPSYLINPFYTSAYALPYDMDYAGRLLDAVFPNPASTSSYTSDTSSHTSTSTSIISTPTSSSSTTSLTSTSSSTTPSTSTEVSDTNSTGTTIPEITVGNDRQTLQVIFFSLAAVAIFKKRKKSILK